MNAARDKNHNVFAARGGKRGCCPPLDVWKQMEYERSSMKLILCKVNILNIVLFLVIFPRMGVSTTRDWFPCNLHVPSIVNETIPSQDTHPLGSTMGI